MSRRMMGILVAAFFITLIFAFLSHERGAPSSDVPVGSPDIGMDSNAATGKRLDDSVAARNMKSSEDRGQAGKVVVGDPVNPTIDRWGVPATSSFPVQRDSRQSGVDAPAHDGAYDRGSVGSPGASPHPGQLPGPGGSGYRPLGSPSEASGPQISGPAPEASDPGVMGLAPEAGGLPLDYGAAPEAGQPDTVGLPPEASDPGTMGPAPEDSVPTP